MSDPYLTGGRDSQAPKSGDLPTIVDEPAQTIGRYRVERILGQGGFGLVYLAHDEQLDRRVAIKVPRPELIAGVKDAELYLAEARTAANLDHPNIVPVFDIGSSPEFPYFIVSKFIEGETLAQRIHDGTPPLATSVEWVATIAEALHHAHGKGIVHRDVKPGNILLDAAGKAHVGDFGLALSDEPAGRGTKYIGTPAYMSPEQAHGEGHRVDGRSDIFSLGILMYELLAGRPPFTGESIEQLLDQIIFAEAPPLRRFNADLPKELERICQKAMAKRTSERYTTAKDLAEELRHFLEELPVSPRPSAPAGKTADAAPPRQASPAHPTPSGHAETPSNKAVSANSVGWSVKIVPKGLRAFDVHDADFFLELVPGPRDRIGLPDSIRFWKTRIEETDADDTFAVGLIYGPSGCGKSSLMKAGLLPRLSDNVLAVYIEATAEETEKRLLNGLRRRCPGVPASLPLKETMTALRRGQGVPQGKKVLIVLDQFEQWLHAHKAMHAAELVQAVRQCDGGRLQCIIMVRDDFWMAATRFMRDLEIRLAEGKNSVAVDLFDRDHAYRVLAAFGRAFARLPEETVDTNKEQTAFLTQAVTGLAQEGRVISVRLALFAEMMKGKPWTPAALHEAGGAEGIGALFLEETFSAATAPPEHRYHQKAVRAVLTALLPEPGADIKGHMRPRAALLDASGYAHRPSDFDDLIRILDTELRLITPTDPEGKEGMEDSASPVSAGDKYYQLTHDYLVHSLRDWLTRKQKETRRGRAELLLADRAAVWCARPETRQLPSLFQWLSIRLLTRKRDWTDGHKKMMRSARGFHLRRALGITLLLALIGWGCYEGFGALQARALRDRLLHANISDVPAAVQDLLRYRRWAAPLLQDAYREAQANGHPRKQLHASLALLPMDPTQQEYLFTRLLDAAPQEVPVLRDALAPHRGDLLAKLWASAERPAKGNEPQRLRACAALALYDPANERWRKIGDALAGDLVGVPTVFLGTWLDAFRPVREPLIGPLGTIFRDGKRRETERSLATDILADFAAMDPLILGDLAMDANDQQFAVLLPKLARHSESLEPMLRDTVTASLAAQLNDTAKNHLANRQANAAIILMKMGQADVVWPLLKHSSDPRARSGLLHRLAPLGVDVDILLQRLDVEEDVSIQRALLLALSLYDTNHFPADRRAALLPRLVSLYQDHPDPGLHAAAGWLLREWNLGGHLTPIDEAWKNDAPARKERLERIQKDLRAGAGTRQAFWFVNGQGQTMVALSAPAVFSMGSPAAESGREEGNMELRHEKRILRPFAIAAHEVTVRQFLRFRPKHVCNPQYAPTPECPVNKVTWYDAAAYCNWLSEQEGMSKDDLCYLPNAAGDYADGMKLAPGYLERMGYRLPSEAEWEYACRAGATTARYFGESGELLDRYAWFTTNTMDREMKPVGKLKPNDFGLFDMLGNALEWCQDPSQEYPPATAQPRDDKEHPATVLDKQYRALRSGAFYYALISTRSANRSRNVPTVQTNYIGFRPARTVLK